MMVPEDNESFNQKGKMYEYKEKTDSHGIQTGKYRRRDL